MENNQSRNNKKSIIISIVILAVAVIALLYYFNRPDKQTSPKDLNKDLENLQINIPPSANPLQLTTPEKTPVEKTNPFQYENPFE